MLVLLSKDSKGEGSRSRRSKESFCPGAERATTGGIGAAAVVSGRFGDRGVVGKLSNPSASAKSSRGDAGELFGDRPEVTGGRSGSVGVALGKARGILSLESGGEVGGEGGGEEEEEEEFEELLRLGGRGGLVGVKKGASGAIGAVTAGGGAT